MLELALKKVVEKMVELSLTPTDVEKLKKVRFNDVPEVWEFEGDGIASLVLPLIKNTSTKGFRNIRTSSSYRSG